MAAVWLEGDEDLKPASEKGSADVHVYLLEELPDGTLRVGNSHECGVEEAKSLIDSRKAKAPAHAIGVVPPEWS